MPKLSNSKLQQKWDYFRQANEVRVANLKERFLNKKSLKRSPFYLNSCIFGADYFKKNGWGRNR